MFAEVEKFFTAILGDGVDVTIIHAFLICLAVLIIYAFILRPFINLVGGKNGGRFFDITVMILIVLVGVKTLYPDILTEGGYTKSDLLDYYDQGYSDGKDYGEMISWDSGYDAGYAEALKDYGIDTEDPDDTEPPASTETPEPDTPSVPAYASVDEFFATYSCELLTFEYFQGDVMSGTIDDMGFYITNIGVENDGLTHMLVYSGSIYSEADYITMWFDDSYYTEVHLSKSEHPEYFTLVATIDGSPFYRISFEDFARATGYGDYLDDGFGAAFHSNDPIIYSMTGTYAYP